MDSSSDLGNGPCRSVSTLVFMDLEATGLPCDVGRNNVNITEIAMVAIDRENFQEDRSLRILNKLTLCVRPRAPISYPAMAITGLYNDVLENQGCFDDTVPKMLEYFFRRLRKPICILAHNGKKYDFPLLQAELNHINYGLDPQILCGDTLEAFRLLTSQPLSIPRRELGDKTTADNNNNKFAINTRSLNKVNSKILTDQEAEDLLSQDIHMFVNIEEPKPKMPCNLMLQSVKDKNSAMKTQSPSLIDEHTPPRHFSTEKTPQHLNPPRKSQSEPAPSSKYHGRVLPNNTSTKRKLFSTTDAVQTTKKISCALDKLYVHFFGEDPPISHYAEADCITLGKVCQHVSKEFLEWVDVNSVSFSEISPMW